MSKITYSDKEYIYENASIPEINKITDVNMNEIKSVVNENDTRLSTVENGISNVDTRLTTAETNQGILTNLTTTEKTNFVSAINEVDSHTDGNTTDITNLQTGWNVAEEIWTYSSVDDPTGVITISGDKTTKYSLGMRIKFTNATNVIYGIIIKISYSSPNTTITFLHEIDPTDSLALHLLQNSAITDVYYSSAKVPYGFPMNPDSWTLKSVLTSGATGGAGTNWQNLGGLNVVCPIGVFKISGSAQVKTSGIGNGYFVTCISNSNNTSYDPEMRCRVSIEATFEAVSFVPEKTIVNTSKTIYYLNHMFAFSANNTSIEISAPGAYALTSYIKVVCAYL